MQNEDAFLLALNDDPADEASWLALADWLEENGRSDQAELLRLHRSVRSASDAAAVQRIRQLLKKGVRPIVPEITNSIGMRLALIPAGTFIMGSHPGEAGREPCEDPPHEVEITKPFYLGVFPVTQGEFEAVMKYNRSDFREGGGRAESVEDMDTPRFPVENVDWDEADSFCQKLSKRAAEKKAERKYRLPTEAEWEYACRAWLGGDPFYLGKTISSRLANYRGTHPYRGSRPGPDLDRTSEVGLYPPNPFGLYDMLGNVWEWCNDFYDENYYLRSPRQDPRGPEDTGERVQRGGCWGAIGACTRSASRTSDGPEEAQYCFGFRVAISHKSEPRTK